MFRWIPLQEHDAFMNMALDEAICESIQAGTSPPTIRLYTWKPAAISIGYFQGLLNEVDIEKCKQQGVDIVRRRTGGGAVLHEDEITYSILGSEELFPKNIIESYQYVCNYLIEALKQIGIEGQFSPINDIIVDGKKISGNAQTRRNGIFQMHGTLLYTVDVDKMFSLLKVGQEKIADKLIQSVKKRVTSIKDLSDASKQEIVNALYQAFSKDRDIEIGTYTPEEIARAKELVELKYNTTSWNAMR